MNLALSGFLTEGGKMFMKHPNTTMIGTGIWMALNYLKAPTIIY
jgi:hypothetical protein